MSTVVQPDQHSPTYNMSEDLLTRLAMSHHSLLKFASMSADDFRLDYRSNFNTLSFKVWDVLDMLTEHSICQVVWFSYLVAADMVDMFIRVAAVATREININSYDTIDAVIIRLMVRVMLPELMLTKYSIHYGEIMLQNELSLLLRNLECDK